MSRVSKRELSHDQIMLFKEPVAAFIEFLVKSRITDGTLGDGTDSNCISRYYYNQAHFHSRMKPKLDAYVGFTNVIDRLELRDMDDPVGVTWPWDGHVTKAFIDRY